MSEAKPGLLGRAKRWAGPWIEAGKELANNDGFQIAGHLAFTAFMAIFPFLIFLAALFGILGDVETAQTLVNFLFKFAPKDVAETLSGPIFSVMLAHHEDLLTLGILGTLWAASSWFEALRLALNNAYDIDDPRPMWKRRLQSIVFVLFSAVVMAITAFTIVLGPVLWQLFERIMPLAPQFEVAWNVGRYIIGGLLFGGFLLVLHQYLPPRRHRWRELLAGVAVTLFTWLIVTTALSIYLALAGNYDATYGALGGVVITLMFFYIAALVFIFGAELNAAYHPFTKQGTKPD